MAAADVVVTAAGTSTWELCALRRPMALVAAVDNQRAGHDRVVAAGGAVGLGGLADLADVDATAARLRPLLTDAALRRRVADRGPPARRRPGGLAGGVDVGGGAHGIPAPCRRPGRSRCGRRASMTRAPLLEWRNDPVTRAVSRHHGVVALDDHLTWLRAALERPDRHLLVGSLDGARRRHRAVGPRG